MMNIMKKQTLWDRIYSNETFKKAFDEYNKSIGGALRQLPEQPQTIQGRETEIQMLAAIMERPKTPIAALIAQAGTGKSALVEEFVKQCNNGQVFSSNIKRKYVVLSLRLGSLSAMGNYKLQSILAELFDQIKKFEDAAIHLMKDDSIRFILFIDEFHMLVTIFGPGTKVGGDVIKEALARSPIRVIAATTRKEYDSTIAVDEPLKERFKNIEMHELPPNIVKDICIDWWSKIAPDCPMPDTKIIERIIKANSLYRSDSAEPRKTLDILEDLVSYCRRTGLVVTNKQVDEIFKNRYSINLTFEVDPDEVYNEIARRIKGQPFALYELRRSIRSMTFQLDPMSNRPRLRLLFVGPTGVGKTETVKGLQASLYPGENVLLNLNMPDFKTLEHEPLFRKKLGEFVRHTPNAIILLDEFEKAHPGLMDSMLTILDEGIVNFEVTNREGAVEVHSVSLRNTIVIATSNAGAEVFANDAKFSQSGDSLEINDATKAEMLQLNQSISTHLQANGFKPEMLGRFNSIVSYRRLNSAALLSITENLLDSMIDKFKTIKDIDVILEEPRQWDPKIYNYYTTDVALYITFIKAKADDPNSGGARAIQRELDSSVYAAIVDAAIDNPDCKKFKVSVTKNARIYDNGASATEGGIKVEAIKEE